MSDTQKEKILRLLQANPDGVTNYQLNEIAFRYGAIKFILCQEGYDIENVHIKDSLWIMVLMPENLRDNLDPKCGNSLFIQEERRRYLEQLKEKWSQMSR